MTYIFRDKVASGKDDLHEGIYVPTHREGKLLSKDGDLDDDLFLHTLMLGAEHDDELGDNLAHIGGLRHHEEKVQRLLAHTHI